MRKVPNLLWVAASYLMFIANIWLLAAPFTAPFLINAATTYGGGLWTETLTGYVNSTVLDLTLQFYLIMGGLLLINLNVMLATRFRALRNLANYVNVAFGAVASFVGLAAFGAGAYLGWPTAHLVTSFVLLTLGWVYLDIAVRHLRGEKVNVAFRVAPEEELTDDVPVTDVPVVETTPEPMAETTEPMPDASLTETKATA
jgi:hypothetical protein